MGHRLVAAASGAVVSGRAADAVSVLIGRRIRVIDAAFSLINPGWAPAPARRVQKVAAIAVTRAGRA